MAHLRSSNRRGRQALVSISLLTSWMYVVGCERQPSEQAPSVEFSDPVQFEFRIVGEPQSVEDLARYAALIQRRLARSIPGGLRVTALETRGLLVEMERAAADDDHTQIALKVLSAPPPKLEFRIIANPEDEEAGLWDRYRSNLERDGPTLQAGDAHFHVWRLIARLSLENHDVHPIRQE